MQVAQSDAGLEFDHTAYYRRQDPYKAAREQSPSQPYHTGCQAPESPLGGQTAQAQLGPPHGSGHSLSDQALHSSV